MSTVRKSTASPGPAAAAAALAAALAAVALGHGEHGWEACRHGKLAAFARADAAFDEESGRDLRNYPPDRTVDFLHMKLRMRFEDLDDRRFEANEALKFEPIGTPTAVLTLDAVGLQIGEVRLDNRPQEFYHDGEQLSVAFASPLPLGRTYELTIDYVCDDPWDGMFFTPSDPEVPHYSAEVHTQGQTETNRHWFIANDFPNERMTTELIVNVPAGYSVSSNGRLLSKLESGDRANWHWLQEKPHVSYLVSLVIGRFDVVPIPHPRVPMAVWVPEGRGPLVAQTYGRTGEMIDLFEQRFGLPYPWERYDQLVVKNFNAGGMENTAATTMHPSAILDERALLDGDLEGLIAHELAHQWTGDLITCKSWEHIWLNEGWATFGDALWAEQRDGEDGYLDEMRGNFGVARRDRSTDELPMVSPVYADSGETFGRRANPYPKGASILHMLRMMLGEEVFWEGTRRYMSRHALGVVETSDFRYAMEEASGRGLEWFFDQWCYRPGCPNLEVDTSFEPGSRELRLEITQTQHIDQRTPAMRFTLPVHVKTEAGWSEHAVTVTERTTTFRTVLDGVPAVVAVDPELHVLKTIEVDKPLPMWIAQLAEGPTIAARHAALEALGDVDSSETIELLAGVIADEQERYTLRRTALRALRGYASDEARERLTDLCTGTVTEARVRSELTEAAADLDAERVIAVLAERAADDPSYATRAAAIRALAAHESAEHADLIAGLVHEESHRQQVRSAALRALAGLDDPRGLELAMQYAAYGNLDRARPTAIDVIADLAHVDRDRAVPFLVELLDDPEQRTRRAAARALGRIGDERGLAPLQRIAGSHRDPAYRALAERMVRELEGE